MTARENGREVAEASANDGPMLQWRNYLRAGRFMLQRCEACSRQVFYPRVVCPHCGGDSLHWEQAGGSGCVYSTSTVSRRAGNGGDYNVSLIDLDEGVRLMSRVDGIAPTEVTIGMKVRAEIAMEAGEPVLVFRRVGH